MERRRAGQRNAEASAGETTDEMLARMREDLQVAPAETAEPKVVTQGSKFLSVSGALTSTVVGGAQAGAVVERPVALGSAPAETVGARPGVRPGCPRETSDGERRARQEEPGEELRHPVRSPAALGPCGCSA